VTSETNSESGTTSYVRNSPLMLVDPFGLDPIQGPGGCIWNPDTNNLWCPNGGGGTGPGGGMGGPGGGQPCTFVILWHPRAAERCGGGGGGGGNPRTGGGAQSGGSSPPQTQSYADCVKDVANVDSIQNLTHAGNGFLASAFLSNTFSSFIQLGQDITALHFFATGNDLAQDALSNGLGPLAQNAARNIPNVAVSAAAVSITASESGIQTAAMGVRATLPFGTLAQVGAGLLADVFTGKTIYDAGIALGASGVCEIPGIR
jgi:hypothetical protein